MKTTKTGGVEPKLDMRLRQQGRTVELRSLDSFYPSADTVTIILSGMLDCVMLSPSAQEFIVQRIVAGDIICTLDSDAKNYCDRTYIAIEDSSVVTMAQARFADASAQDRGLSDLLVSAFTRQVEACYTRVYELCFLPANVRIYWHLLRLSRWTAEWFPLDTHQMIANQLAVSRETVSREIGALIGSGLAERQDRLLRVVDVQRLVSRVRRHLRYQSRLLDP